MGDPCRTAPFRDNRVASRKAEEAALRRFQAAGWVESMVGPLGLSSQPSEMEFVSCLRNGLVLCNLINKIQPGTVPKVINNQSPRLSFETPPPPAYQYFENIRNFLVAVEELKLPAFEASDLERDTLESGSTTKIVDCILALKSFHEWKMYNGGNGLCKFIKSPVVPHSSKFFSHVTSSRSELCRCLNMLTDSKKQEIPNMTPNSEGLLVKMLSEQVLGLKENVDHNLMTSVLNGISDPVKVFTEIISTSLLTQQLKSDQSSMESAMLERDCKHCNWCLGKVNCNHWQILVAHEKELGDLKVMLSRAKKDVLSLQCQLQSDLMQLGSQIQGLSVAALGYSEAMRENRNLYNLLQDLKGNIRVYCRIRPSFNTEVKSSIDFIGDDGSLVIVDPLKMKSDSRKIFQFNKVFGATATQGEVYKDTQSLIRSVMDGYNVCIFAYGQTGSGKTHTMFGPSNESKDLGINYLALNDLFEISCARNDVIKYEVRVQMVEIYNDQVRDLLAEDTTTTKLEIRSCSGNGGLSLPDATICPVRSPEDVQELMKLGERNRVLCSTAINQRSSRSHSILTVHVQGKEISGDTIYSRLHLVDLAGSERVDKSEVTGDRLKEAQHINKSLSCLGDVITALGQKNSHVPYRNCKLTQLLQDSLGGQAKTLMFAHVSPEAGFYEETVSTLRFAQRVSKVELGAALLNKERNEVRQLKEQVENLKKALASKQGEKSEFLHKVKGRIPEQVAELIPPCAGQLSLENHSPITKQKDSSLDEKNVQKSTVLLSKSVAKLTPLGSRRLSLEGLNHGKNQQLLTENSDIHSSIPHPVSSERNVVDCPFLPEVVGVNGWNATATLCSDNIHSAGASDVNETFRQRSSSPICSSYQSQIPKVENRSRIMPLQQPKTPESLSNLEEAITPREAGGLSCKSSQPRFRSSNTSGKGSQIRKSLRTIGKLINSSERRNHQSSLEKPSPVRGKRDGSDGDSSTLSASARALRRQSLTNLPTSGFRASRRSSLGGKSTDSYSYETHIAVKTPQSVHSSSKVTKRWL